MGQFEIDARMLKELDAGNAVEGSEELVKKHEEVLTKYYALKGDSVKDS